MRGFELPPHFVAFDTVGFGFKRKLAKTVFERDFPERNDTQKKPRFAGSARRMPLARTI